MNMLIEPVELQESECNAQGWQIAGALDDPAPDEMPDEPQGVPEVAPDFDQPDTGPSEIPEY